MGNFLKIFVKKLLRKTLLLEAVPTEGTLAVYRKLPASMLADRSFYFGGKKMAARALAMEAAPGTAETVIQILQGLGLAPGQTILDFGCGQHQSKYLKDMGFTVPFLRRSAV